MKGASTLLPALVALLFIHRAARAELQHSGSEDWPGKVQVGFHPLGAQVGFRNSSISGYKLAWDISGKLNDRSRVTAWLGGGFNYAAGTFNCAGIALHGATCGHDLQVWLFVMLTFEKFVRSVPLVPFVRAGAASDIFLSDASGASTIAGGGFRVGGGFHYYVIRYLGLGIETNLTLGGASNSLGFYGSWDFGLGARVAF